MSSSSIRFASKFVALLAFTQSAVVYGIPVVSSGSNSGLTTVTNDAKKLGMLNPIFTLFTIF